MFKRLRSGWLAGSGATLLVLSISGVVMGATVLTSDAAPVQEVTDPEIVVDTTMSFEDIDGDGIDDDCDDAVTDDPVAAAAALEAADLNGDDIISVSEAAQSGWVGGPNCNHGGYVSQLAKAQDDDCVAEEPAEEPPVAEEPTAVLAEFDEDDLDESVDENAPDEDAPEAEDDSDAEDCTADEPDEAVAPVEDGECVVVPAPEPDPALDPNAPNAHGTWVSSVAKSDAIGGKNCNHGGAVSEAAKKDHEAAAAAREARKAEHAAQKAEREAARAAKKAAHQAAKAAKLAGKSHGHGHNH